MKAKNNWRNRIYWMGCLLATAFGCSQAHASDMNLPIFYTQYGFQNTVPTVSFVNVHYSSATNTISFSGNVVLTSSALDPNFTGDDGIVVNPYNGNLLIASGGVPGVAGTVNQVTQSGAEANPFIVSMSEPISTTYDLVVVPPNGTNSGFPAGVLIGTEKEFGHDYITIFPLSPALATGTDYPVTGDDIDVDSIAFDANGVAYYASGTVTSNAGNFGVVTFDGSKFTTHRLFTGAFGSHRVRFDPFTSDIFAVGGNTVGQYDPKTSQFHILAINGVANFFQLSTPLMDGQGHLLISACCGEPGDNRDGEGDLIVVDYSAAPGHLIDASSGVQYTHTFLAENFVSAAVNPLPLNSIAVTPSNPSMLPGAKQQFTATGTFQGGATQNINSQVTWSSSDSTIASVSNTGVVTAVSTGSATISATVNGVIGSTTVTVPALVSIQLSPANPTVTPGSTQAFTAMGTYQGGGSQQITPSLWSSSNTTVATIDANGVATAIATGTSTISAKLSGVTGTTVLTAPPLVSIAVTPANPSAYAGNTVQLTATGTYQGGGAQNITTQVTWSSDNTGAATINGAGLATAIAVGNATISASMNSISGHTTFTVPLTPPAGLALHYTLDTSDDAGSVALDSSGNGDNGTIFGNPSQVNGKLNQGLSFDGATQYISAPALSPTEFFNSVTVAAWINTTNTSRWEAIVSKYSASGSGAGYLFRTDSGGFLEMFLGGSNISFGTTTAVDTTKINDGQWHHIVGVITIGQDVKFYVDGNFSSATVIHSLANGDNSTPLMVGSNSFGFFGTFFTGSMDDVRIYNRALSSSEVNTLFLLSGGTGGSTPPPVATPTFTPTGGAYSGTQQVTIASTTAGASIRYTTDGSSPSETAGTLYNGPVTVSGSMTVRAIAYASGMSDSSIAAATYTINSGPTGNSAQFVKTDTTTQGNWQSAYGADGFNVINDTVNYPSYATVTPNGQAAWSWATSTGDARGLQKFSIPGDRIAATWYSSTSFTVDINFTDGNTHQVGVYCVDWDNLSRSERIDIFDGQNNAILDTRTVSSFAGVPQYLVWNLKGHTIIKITALSGPNAVLSGIFFGAGGSGVTPTSTAQFVKTDTTTQGNWQGVYGADGFNVINDTVHNPSYATVTPTGQLSWTWASSTTDPRALQKFSNPSDRIAGTWYAQNSFSVDLNLTDGNPHQLAVYGVDWDNQGRKERIDVIDAQTGIVLDSQTISSFSTTPQYLVWNLKGHIVLRFTSTGGLNAVLSGIFFN